jgi:nucleotide-binding universal stress UspA family protein
MSERIHRILVPVDGSEASARAARLGRDLASGLGVPLVLLYVYTPGHGQAAGAAQLSREEVQAASARVSRDAFASVEAALGAPVPEEERKVTWGEPADEIIGFARHDGPVLVVMGRRGLGAMASLLLGSVSKAVLDAAPGPVVLVP